MDSSKFYINWEPNTLVGRTVVVRLNRDWIFDWQVYLAFATTFLCILLLQYTLKLIPCSELSFRGPKLGPYQLATRIRDYVLTQRGKKSKSKEKNPTWFTHQLATKIRDYILTQREKNPSWFTHQLANKDSRQRTHKKIQLIHSSTDKQGFEFTYSCKIPVDLYINCRIRQTRFSNLVKPSWSQINVQPGISWMKVTPPRNYRTIFSKIKPVSAKQKKNKFYQH